MTTKKRTAVDAPARRRCVWVRDSKTRCQLETMQGGWFCPEHQAEEDTRVEFAKKRVAQGLGLLVRPIDADDWEADPLNSFELEFRRTVARIRYYDEKIIELDSERDLIWGVTKHEAKDEYGFHEHNDGSYRLVVNESKVHLYHELQFNERKHLTELHKLWISAKLDTRRLELQEQTVLMLNDAITSIVRGLGRDASDPEVRQVVRAALVALPTGSVDLSPSGKAF